MDIQTGKNENNSTFIFLPLRECTLSRAVLPVFVGSSLKNIGVQTLLDGVVDLLPSPTEANPVEIINAKNGKTEICYLKKSNRLPTSRI